MRERAQFWQVRDAAGPVDFLKACYYTHIFPKHTHDEYVFGVVTRGVEAFEREGVRYDAQEGRIVVINPGEVHTAFAPLEIGWSYRVLYPGGASLARLLRLDGGRSGELPGFSSALICDPPLAADFLTMHRIHEESSCLLRREEAFCGVMARLFRRYGDRRLPPSPRSVGEPRAVAESCDYLSARYRENPSLADLAALTGLSPWHLTRVFSRTMGVPPHSWLNQYRLGRARDLLARGCSVGEAAGACGFSDQSHLTRRFKRYFGVTPGSLAARRRPSPGGPGCAEEGGADPSRLCSPERSGCSECKVSRKSNNVQDASGSFR